MFHYNRLFERYPNLALLKEKVLGAYMALYRTYRDGGKLLVCGNGGSAADSDHIVGELMKGFYKKRPLDNKIAALIGEDSGLLQGTLPAIALTQHNALSTAFLNDVDPIMTFAQQVLGYGKRGDAFIGISTSGNSKNVIKAAQVSKALGLKTIALTGDNGGQLGKICDWTINVPGETTADIQEYHLPVYHTLCAMLEAAFFN
ncbi:MAG: SIS domain-containing protein [Firmicutes bacterium]|nr:SIS domain-containing protein [Bacillota bacterium]